MQVLGVHAKVWAGSFFITEKLRKKYENWVIGLEMSNHKLDAFTLADLGKLRPWIALGGLACLAPDWLADHILESLHASHGGFPGRHRLYSVGTWPLQARHWKGKDGVSRIPAWSQKVLALAYLWLRPPQPIGSRFWFLDSIIDTRFFL